MTEPAAIEIRFQEETKLDGSYPEAEAPLTFCMDPDASQNQKPTLAVAGAPLTVPLDEAAAAEADDSLPAAPTEETLEETLEDLLASFDGYSDDDDASEDDSNKDIQHNGHESAADMEIDIDAYLGREDDDDENDEEGQVLAKLEANPQAIRETVSFPWNSQTYTGLPLHLALCKRISEPLLLALLAAHPAAAKHSVSIGNDLELFPLAIAVAHQWSEEVVIALLEAYPAAAQEPTSIEWEGDDCQGLPLHLALEKGLSEKALMALIQANPQAVQTQISYMVIFKVYALHIAIYIAIENQLSEPVIMKLLQIYPQAAQERFGDSYPLHLAIENELSDGLVMALLDAYPEAAKAKEARTSASMRESIEKAVKGCRFHDVIGGKGFNARLVVELMEEEPDVVFQKDTKGRLPIHVAVQKHAPEDTIRVLLERHQNHPAAAVLKDAKGKLPLHVAAISDSSLGVMKTLLEAFPEAAGQTDIDGRLPLHLATQFRASLGVVKTLLKAHPDAARQRDHSNKLPLDLLLEEYSNTEKETTPEEKQALERVVRLLLEADMPIRLVDGKAIAHGGSWTLCVASTFDIAAAAVSHILAPKTDGTGGGGYHIHIHKLSKVLDDEGRTALELSASRSREAIYKYLLFCGRYELSMSAPEHVSATSILLRARDCRKNTDYGSIFDAADTDKSGTLDQDELKTLVTTIGLEPEIFLRGVEAISKNEFIGECRRLLGDGSSEVVIKLMESKENWDREKRARDQKMDANHVIQLLPNVPTDDSIAKAVGSGSGGLDQIVMEYNLRKPGKYAVIMDAADRNLHQIVYQERPRDGSMRDLLKQVFEAVAHLHQKKVMHGDLTMLNVVRLSRDNRLRLIDFDAAEKIFGPEDDEESFAGAKFSSATLPPEMFFEMEAEEQCKDLEAYWKGSNKDKEILAKVTPKAFTRRGKEPKWYAVKSFYMKDGKPVDENLPYDLQNASEKIDVWALGVLAFALLTGETIVPANRDDDCTTGAAMAFLHNWGDREEEMKEKFGRISDLSSRNLVRKMLQRNPLDRPSMAELLQDPFFQTGNGDTEMKESMAKLLEEAKKLDKLDTIISNQAKITELININKALIQENKEELKRTCKLLLRGMFEATEVEFPTTFIVLEDKLPDPMSEEEKGMLEINNDLRDDMSSLSFSTINPKDLDESSRSLSMSFRVSKRSTDTDAETKVKKHMEAVETGMKWVDRIKEMSINLLEGNADKVFDKIRVKMGDMVSSDTMYLYLVDELTGQPVQAEGWPIDIKKPKKEVTKFLPLMYVGLRAMTIYNGTAGIARMFGFPIPIVPEMWSNEANDSVRLMKGESPVADYSSVQTVVDSQDKLSQSLRGTSLREFVQFLKRHDPLLKKGHKEGDFAGLHRIGNTMEGTALWTTLTDPKDINDAIEKRTLQRKLEESRSSLAGMQAQGSAPAGVPSSITAEVKAQEEPLSMEKKIARTQKSPSLLSIKEETPGPSGIPTETTAVATSSCCVIQ